MDESGNIITRNEQNSNPVPLQEQTSPSKWFNITLKTWAIFSFLTIVVVTIEIASSFLSSLKEIRIELAGVSISYLLILNGLYAVAFVRILVFLIPFWGSFKLRKWVLPLLFALSLLSAVDILEIFFHQSIQFSAESIFFVSWNMAIIALTVLGFVFRHNFFGTYRKLLPQIVFFVFVIPALVVGSLTLLFPDLPKISDSDLITYDITLPPKEENAYFSLVKINEQIYEPTGEANKKYMEFLENKSWDQAEADSILSKNEDVLTEMRKATTLSYYQCPATAENISFAVELCPLNYLRKGARIVSLSALSKIHKGDFRGAIEDALVPVQIGQLLIQEPHITLIEYLVGDATKRIGLKTFQVILTTYEIPSEILLPRISELEKYLQNEEGLKNAFGLEYLAWKNDSEFINKIDSNFYIQPNRFFTEMAEYTREKMALTDIPCHQLKQVLKEYKKDFEGKIPKIVIWKLPFTRNAVFEVLKSVIMADLSNTQEKRCEADLLTEQTRLQMALKAYKYDNNKHPVSQSELIPKYLTGPILNPLTNNVFVFNKDTGEIILPDQ